MPSQIINAAQSQNSVAWSRGSPKDPSSLQWHIDNAASKGGACLSTEYKGAKARLEFECHLGHRWGASGNNVKCRGSWCPECSRPGRPLDPNGLRWHIDNAASKGGKCLSTEYKGSAGPLDFECNAGHRWTAGADNVKNGGSWCPQCAKRASVGLQWHIDNAVSHGGKCHSIEYLHSSAKLDFECRLGHIWSARASSVKNLETWCPQCAKSASKRPRIGLRWHIDNAASKGGRCLSTEYAGSGEALDFECGPGHGWSMNAGRVRQGAWCPQCAKSRRDEQAKAKGGPGKAGDYLRSIQDFAERRGERLLSANVKSRKDWVEFERPDGSRWGMFFLKLLPLLDANQSLASLPPVVPLSASCAKG